MKDTNELGFRMNFACFRDAYPKRGQVAAWLAPIVVALGATFAAPAVGASDVPALPEGIQTGELLYHASMANAGSVDGWRMEGPGKVDFRDGWMHMWSPEEKMHHVFWCPQRFPESFVAQWQAQNLHTELGLCIVFFAAAGSEGESVFSDDLPPRDGTFGQYTRGAIRCYHASYYANAPDAPDRQQTNLRKNPGFHLVSKGEEGIPTKSEAIHTVTLAKHENRIRLWIDDRNVIDWTDTGETGGRPHGDGYIGFRQMQWTRFRYRSFRVWSVPRGEASSEDVGLDAVRRRRRQLLAEVAASPLNQRARNPKHQHPIILARLALDDVAAEHLAYLPRGAAFRDRGSMFGMLTLAAIVAGYEDRLPEDVVESIRSQVTRYPSFLAGGTENHRAMQRAAGFLFGERWPDDTFHHGISGRELAAVCKQYVADYGRTVYAGSMREYLSPVYHTTNTAAWLALADYARDDETRLMARAIVDWMMADLALNCHFGAIVPPYSRCVAPLKGFPGQNRRRLGASVSTAWLYWGGAEEPELRDAARSSSVPQHAVSGYAPHVAIRNIGAKRVALPYSVRQSRPSAAFLEPPAQNAHGYQAREEPEYYHPEPRYHMRTAYLGRNYALGSGHFRENVYDPGFRDFMPFGAVWRSENDHAHLVVAHPYWYANYTPEPWESGSTEDMWSGVSPFQQTVQWENAAVVLYNIPEVDPYRDVVLRWGPHWARPDRPDPPVQACFAYYPESVDERARTEAGFFLREGDVYLAIRPLREGAAWAESQVPGFARIDMPGGATGCVVELGDASEFGSFAEFQQQVARAELDVTRLASHREVEYCSTRGHRLRIRHVSEGWLPEAWINGEKVDFDNWPICESPFVTCRDRVLDVHDGRQGFTVDWTGRKPVYSYFEIVEGVRRASDHQPSGGKQGLH